MLVIEGWLGRGICWNARSKFHDGMTARWHGAAWRDDGWERRSVSVAACARLAVVSFFKALTG